MELLTIESELEQMIRVGCNTCYFKVGCDWGCNVREKKRTLNGKFYISTAQIESLIEEAEKKWRDAGGLVVCSERDDCGIPCPQRGPHKITNYGTTYTCNKYGTIARSKFVAYRGEDKKELEEAGEYVCIKKMSIKELARVDINPDIFKETVRCIGLLEMLHKPREAFLPEGFVMGLNEELERLGFIEEKVQDPVVNSGDCFKDGTFMCKIVKTDGGRWCLIELRSGHQQTDFEIPENKDHVLLSELVGDTMLKRFKPCKIKITEVEGGGGGDAEGI